MADATVRVVVRKQKTMNALDRIMAAAVDLTPGAVEECVDQTQRDTATLLRRKQHAPGTPTPSMRGEPPAKISGDLADSVEATRAHEVDMFVWSAQVGPTNPPPYGRIQELGGVTGRGHRTRLPPRPYQSKAVAELMAVAFYEGVYRTWWGEVIRHH
jgi:phage gpG-like protein